jgi:four helix bundle protein
MTRDHRKLRVFVDADALVLDVYRLTAYLPPSERFGLQSQIRRAAVSAVANIVEGAARPGDRDYQRFLYVSLASARECAYLIGLAARLHYLETSAAAGLVNRYGRVQASLLQLCRAIEARG